MSTVTNLILTTGLEESEHGTAIGILQGWLKTEGHPPLVAVDKMVAPAGKAMEAEVWIGAYNGLHLERFTQVMEGLEWRFPEEVRLYVRRQDDEAFMPWGRP